MREYDLSVTYGDARRELQPAFELFEPITIHGRILDCYYPGNLLTGSNNSTFYRQLYESAVNYIC